MTPRVLLIDPLGDVADVARELEPFGAEVERADTVPAGSSILALLVSPDFRVGEKELLGLPDLRIVAATSTGFDHLDLAAIARAGCWATNVAGYCDDEVADHTIAFILDLLRGVTVLDHSVRDGEWDFGHQVPRRIAGTRLGIVGLGRIGRRVAARASALDMDARGYDPGVPTERLRAFGVEPVTRLEDLLATSDVLTLHVPLTPQTRHMINADALARLPRGAFLVNCARAGLVDHHALGEALERGHVGGAALDVLPAEPPPAAAPALRWPRTIINPHAAFASPATIREPYRRAAAAVAAVLRGDEPGDVVARPTYRQPACPRTARRSHDDAGAHDAADVTDAQPVPVGWHPLPLKARCLYHRCGVGTRRDRGAAMCGIVGLYAKSELIAERLGVHLAAMLSQMNDRGPDSAGVAVYRDPVEPSQTKLTLQHPDPGFDWQRLHASLAGRFGSDADAQRRANHAVVIVDTDPGSVQAYLASQHPDVHVMSAGRVIEIYKEVGTPRTFVEAFQLTNLQGTHALGHTRMATESRVTTLGSHPFSTGLDICLVHNGSLSNHNRLRQNLRREGIPFLTENDTEVAAGYLTWRMREGASLEQALLGCLDDLDGFYTFAVGTADGFAVLRDPVACKPAVMAETDDWVAMSSEFRAIAVLPGADDARIWEPAPATPYIWEGARV